LGGDVLDGSKGCGDSVRPSQSNDDRHKRPQVCQQITSGAARQNWQGFLPHGVKVLTGDLDQVRCKSAQGIGAGGFIPDIPNGGKGIVQCLRLQIRQQMQR
jgi:hypothetical protein